MIQALAIFQDAYRELNHRKLFWVTVAISGLVVFVFAAIGNDEEGLTVLHWSIPFPLASSNFIPTADFYKFVFSSFGVGLWLSWVATVIALISTASIFPDFVDRGSIDLMLSKPIGRPRLFLLKFLTGLLFAAIQVTVFTVASFLVIGIRGGDWEPWLFVAIPLVVLFYSYLFAVQAVIGLLTRSVIASVIGVMFFWLAIFLVQTGDGVTLAWRVSQEITVERFDSKIERYRENAIESEELRRDLALQIESGDTLLDRELAEATRDADFWATRLVNVDDELAREERTLEIATMVNAWLHRLNTVLPKTSETIALLGRILEDKAGVVLPSTENRNDARDRLGDLVGRSVFEKRMKEAIDESHSYTWVLGTSLGFEAIVLGFGLWRFTRRDY
ncbi:MAG: ABC transporter permease [Planctomycetota bacterium]|nr:ABC transporter permease [Planctomycetota bacterium]